MASLPPNVSHVGVVILHNKLKDSVVFRLLTQKQIKIRTSERLPEGAVIVPKGKLAFLMVDIVNPVRSYPSSVETGHNNRGLCENSSGISELLARIDKFIGIHGQCTVILQAPLYTTKEFRIMSALQLKYLYQTVDFVPAHSAEECVEAILTMALVQTPPNCNILHDRINDLVASLLIPPPRVSAAFKEVIENRKLVPDSLEV
ncbi:unnamed protein product [Candidula unifasciata]|uniref:Uncharacterized protein n=1 Tax=Candidula unifasciata TaxID=100452 RepID=A0A8S3Z634_9EUPU|nr:unnamed protein product [Candidula unifasciata]